MYERGMKGFARNEEMNYWEVWSFFGLFLEIHLLLKTDVCYRKQSSRRVPISCVNPRSPARKNRVNGNRA